jgi:hypothetical protein
MEEDKHMPYPVENAMELDHDGDDEWKTIVPEVSISVYYRSNSLHQLNEPKLLFVQHITYIQASRVPDFRYTRNAL